MKKKFFIFCMLASTVGITSCSKFLDKEPLSQATDENFWKTETEANSAIAGGYALLRQSLFNGYAHFAYGDMPTEEFPTNVGGEDMSLVSNFQWQTSVPSTSTARPIFILRRYDNFYRVIDQATRCIQRIPSVPNASFGSPEAATAAKNSLIGEAYFLRAFAYFYMARVWGAVPIVGEQAGGKLGDATDLARSPETEVLNAAKSDLDQAISLLSFGYTNAGNRAVRANKGSAYALLAHLEAWRGNYEAVAAATEQVVTNGGYSLVPMANYLTIWRGQSSEGIFEIAANSTTEANNQSIGWLTLKSPYLADYTASAVRSRLDEQNFRTKFPDSTDQRIRQAFAFYSSTDPNCIKYSNVTYLTTSATGVRSNPQFLNNIVVFRLADIMLLRAEALSAIGQYGEARTLLNQIKTRGVATNTYTGSDANLFAAVIEERSRELFLEGHRFYDLVRLARARGVYNFGGGRMTETEFKAGKYYWPVEPTLMTLNPRLTQTPYWSTRM